MFEVTDDSGFLALVVPAVYETFVDEDWSLDQILTHFQTQMGRHCLLIWGTGMAGFWRVDVRRKKSKVKGFRKVSGGIQVVGGSLLLTNYESLTMAAQFSDVTLPEKHQEHLLIRLPDGSYNCRVIQMFDPDGEENAGEGEPDFVLEIVKKAGKPVPWEAIPWFDVDG
jgi:hypothetical protein